MNSGMQAICAKETGCKCCRARGFSLRRRGFPQELRDLPPEGSRYLGRAHLLLPMPELLSSSSPPPSIISRKMISFGIFTTKYTSSVDPDYQDVRPKANAAHSLQSVFSRQAAAHSRLRLRQWRSCGLASCRGLFSGRDLRPLCRSPFRQSRASASIASSASRWSSIPPIPHKFSAR